jgi:hypothetical protein
VPISPFSRKPTPERPPTSSYNALEVGPGWADLHEGKQGPPYNPYTAHHVKVGRAAAAPSPSLPFPTSTSTSRHSLAHTHAHASACTCVHQRLGSARSA